MRRLILSAIAIVAGLACTSSDRNGIGRHSAAVSPPVASDLGATANLLKGAGPEGWWRLGDFDSTMRDFSSHHINGSYHDGYSLAQPGAIADDNDTAVAFDGVSGFAEVSSHKVYSLTRFWDNFFRPNCGPPNGLSWGPGWVAEVTTSGAHYFSCAGVALIDPLGQSGTFEQGVPGTSLLHGQMQIRARWTAHPQTGALQPVTLVAERVDKNNMVRVELIEQSDHSLALYLIQVVNGQNTYLATPVLTNPDGSRQTYNLGDWWWLRFEFDGPNLSARAWKDGTHQPTVWQASGTASFANVGTVAVRSANSASDVRPQVFFANFWVQSLGLSLSTFIKRDANQSASRVYALSKASDYENFLHPGNQEYYFRLDQEPDGWHLKAYVFNLAGGYGAGRGIPDPEAGFPDFVADKWYHVVMILDPGDYHDLNAGLSIYVNGRLSPTDPYKGDGECEGRCLRNGDGRHTSCDGDPAKHICWTITPLSSDAPLQLGTGESGFLNGDNAFFDGALDDVAIYPRKLSCDEVSKIYNSSCQQSDMALLSGLNVTASSSLSLNPPTAAVDGQLSTFWSSATAAVPQFFRVDLGSARDISMVRMNWKDFPATFRAFISTDGTVWTNKTGIAYGQAGIQDIPINDHARFIHLNLLTPTAATYSLFDAQVFGCNVAPAGCANEWPLAVVGSQQRTFPGSLARLDGSNSFDPDPPDSNPHSLTYSWSLVGPAGTTAVLSATDIPNPTFTPDRVGIFFATLVVTDSWTPAASSFPASTMVTVLPFHVFVTEDLTAGLAVAASLGPSDVTSPRDRRTLVALLTDASAAVQAGKLDLARHKIRRAIIRTDGWSLRGRPDPSGPGKDWILAKDPAMKLYTLLKESLAALRAADDVNDEHGDDGQHDDGQHNDGQHDGGRHGGGQHGDGQQGNQGG